MSPNVKTGPACVCCTPVDPKPMWPRLRREGRIKDGLIGEEVIAAPRRSLRDRSLTALDVHKRATAYPFTSVSDLNVGS